MKKKEPLRRALNSRLAMISPDERETAAARIAQHLLADPAVTSAATILAYAALPSEIDLDPFIVSALGVGKRVCLPVADWETKSMRPVEIRDLDTDLQTGRYAVRTPISGCPTVNASEIGLVILPGLAFDRAGNRLGRGAGFYDRFVHALWGAGRRPALIGVCYQAQIVDRVPTEGHDRPVERVVTEQGPVKGV